MKIVLSYGVFLTLLFGGLPHLVEASFSNTHNVEQKNQNFTIKGRVADLNNEPIIGASIIKKGSTIGTITDANGNFFLNVDENDVLIIKYIGYKDKEVAVTNNKQIISIQIEESLTEVDEVVVIGYGTMKKRDLSGAVSQIRSQDLMIGNPSDLSQGLSGMMAGVQINKSDGAPGGGVSIQIRGTNSFSTSSQPLYIVDGIPFDTGDTPESETNNSTNKNNPLSFINPHDIQSIEVLKDASATAIYGARGANGVVIITTKRGEIGKDQIEFSANIGYSKIARRVDVLDPYTYSLYQNEQVINDYKYKNKPYSDLPYSGKWQYSSLPAGGIDTSTGKYKPSPADFLSPGYYVDSYGNSTWVGGTDWQDLIYQDGISQDYNLRVSGGSEKGWHSFSGSYNEQQGIIKNSGFTRFSLRSNIGRKIGQHIEMGMNTSFTHTDTDFSKTNSSDCGVIRSALVFPTTYDPKNNKAETGELSWLASNPLAYINSTKDNLR